MKENNPYLSDAAIVNYPVWNNPHGYNEKSEKDIFVYAGFVQPGKHNILIYDPDT